MHFEVFMSNDSMIKNQDAMDEAPTLVIKLFASMSCAKSLLIKAYYWNSYLPTKASFQVERRGKSFVVKSVSCRWDARIGMKKVAREKSELNRPLQ